MPYLTQRFAADFETAPGYAASDLDTQVGWAKVAGSGTQDLFVVVGSLMSGVQSLAMRNAAAVTPAAYEKAATAARVASTDVWRVTWEAKVDAGAGTGEKFWVGGTAGASSSAAFGNGNTTAGFQVAVADNGTTVTITTAGNEGQTNYAGLIALGARATMRVEIAANNTFQVLIDTDNDGEGWVAVHTGTLVAGNEAISYLHVGVDAGTSPNDTLHIDNIRVVLVGAMVKVNFTERRQRMAKVKTDIAAVTEGGVVTFAVDVYDIMTGEIVAAARSATLPLEAFQPGDAARRAIDREMERQLSGFEYEERVTEFVASAHEALL